MTDLISTDMDYHTTVLLHEGVEALDVKPDGAYVDVTFGAGGHSKLILSKLGQKGRLVAFDQDADAHQNAPNDDRFELCAANFRFLKQFLAAKGLVQIDGLIADLGVSGHHFDEASRGFSFRFDAPLDMRMNKAQQVDARAVINGYELEDLRRIFKQYGESSFAHQLAREIVKRRQEEPFETTGDLAKLIEQVVPAHKSKGEIPKVFQAIRIEVNDELGVLKELLIQSIEAMKSGGRLVVLSYHSLEDRLVKHFIRSGNFDDAQEKDIYGNINRPFDPYGKVIAPSDEEIESNPRARSAKMRIAIRR